MNDENAPNCPCGRDHAGDLATKFHAPEKYLVVKMEPVTDEPANHTAWDSEQGRLISTLTEGPENNDDTTFGVSVGIEKIPSPDSSGRAVMGVRVEFQRVAGASAPERVAYRADSGHLVDGANRSLLGAYTVGKTMMYPGTEDVRESLDPVMSGFMASIAVPDTPEGIKDIPTGRGPAPDGTPFGAFVTGTMNANDGPVMIATVHIGDGRWVTSVLDLPAMVGSWAHSMIGPELWG